MPQDLKAGDFLIFQLEAGFTLLRLLGVDVEDGGPVWHVAAYGDLFPSVEAAEAAIVAGESLGLQAPHIALTNRAFESTQVASIANLPLFESELAPLAKWRRDPDPEVSDRSIRLMLGLR